MKYNPLHLPAAGRRRGFSTTAAIGAGAADGRTPSARRRAAAGRRPVPLSDNLPIVGAKGGPGGKPGCGSLPDVTKNFPVRQLVTNTGCGTGLDIRPNPGIGLPGYANYFPVTRAVPEPPSIRMPVRGPGPASRSRIPGRPPYGAPDCTGPDGTAAVRRGVPPAEPGPAPPTP